MNSLNNLFKYVSAAERGYLYNPESGIKTVILTEVEINEIKSRVDNEIFIFSYKYLGSNFNYADEYSIKIRINDFIHVNIELNKTEDEWFYIDYSIVLREPDSDLKIIDRNYLKCDQLDGFIYAVKYITDNNIYLSYLH